MPFGIIVTLDSNTDSLVRKIWAEFEKHRVGQTPGSFNEPPHISLAGGIEDNVDDLKSILDQIQIKNTDIRITSYGIFGGESSTVYLKADPSKDFRIAHTALHEMIESRNIVFDQLYAPSKIVFHCTIAIEINDYQLEMGKALMGNWMGNIEAKAIEVQLWKYFPVELISRRLLVEKRE